MPDDINTAWRVPGEISASWLTAEPMDSHDTGCLAGAAAALQRAEEHLQLLRQRAAAHRLDGRMRRGWDPGETPPRLVTEPQQKCVERLLAWHDGTGPVPVWGHAEKLLLSGVHTRSERRTAAVSAADEQPYAQAEYVVVAEHVNEWLAAATAEMAQLRAYIDPERTPNRAVHRLGKW